MASWKQVLKAKQENRHELLIVDKDLEEALASCNGVLDRDIFNLIQLNYLRLSSSSLSKLAEDIENLTNLTNLELQNNKLVELPKAIGKLSKLKLLDVSDNNLETLPEEINNLKLMAVLNVRNNKIESLISLENCTSLVQLDIRLNKIASLDMICYKNLPVLSEIQAASNVINKIPEEISHLSSLKTLNLSENMLTVIPNDILYCTKLKDINLKGNPLVDKRFKKLVESDRGFSKIILDYIKNHCPVSKMKGSKSMSVKNKHQEDAEVELLCDSLSVLSASDNLTVMVTGEMKDLRGYIICFIIRNMDLTGVKIKKFISIQNKLHDEVCNKRVAATIATHDLSKIVGPMKFCAKIPKEIKILPLNKTKVVPAVAYVKSLQEEAENIRKQMKRNTCSGIHRFLYLVEGKEKWPCLVDSCLVAPAERILSLPPITNTEYSKITAETSDVLIEITSAETLGKTKEVAEALILATFDADLSKEKSKNGGKCMTLEPVRILHEDGNLKMVFPSRVDLIYPSERKINVVRSQH